MLGCLLAGWALLLPHDYEALGRSAFYQGLIAANFYFFRSTGYFAGASEEKALLHTWSLAFEEQFYMIFPVMLVGILNFCRIRSRRNVLLFIGVVATVSLLYSARKAIVEPTAAFYLLPSRAWELLTGAFVALMPPAWQLGEGWRREIAAALGLAAILVPCLLYSSNTAFPGIAALPPCLGTAVVIWATSNGIKGPMARPGMLARLLSTRPLVFVGLISYSLYLWHWPLLAFSNYWGLGSMGAADKAVLVGLSCVLAVLSWRFVEGPVRHKTILSTKWSMLLAGGGCLALSATLGAAIAS